MKCTDKVAYETRGEAYEFAKHLRERGRQKSGTYVIYQCQFCGKYHISHFKKGRFKTKMMARQKYNFNDLSEK